MSALPRGITLDAPIGVLRARIAGNVVSCDGLLFTVLRNPVIVLCQTLAATDREDGPVQVSFAGNAEPQLFIESFRDVASWLPEPKGDWTKQKRQTGGTA